MNKNYMSALVPSLPILGNQLVFEEKEVRLVNIICPGYLRNRESQPETFDFPRLSSHIEECPNVLLMIEKMNNLVRKLKECHKKVKVEMILADVAILNYDFLRTVQPVEETMEAFFQSIDQSSLFDKEIIQFIRMSELGYEFSQIPRGGVTLNSEDLSLRNVQVDIATKANEYIGSFCFDRLNRSRVEGTYSEEYQTTIYEQATREVCRFVKEYGLAGQAIQKLYPEAIILFTEPSGYMRGYFYHAYIAPQNRPTVVYLS